MDLQQYERLKFELADILRGVAQVGSEYRGKQEDARQLFARLAEDRFNLVVVGRFSRGKTSLMNAILGTDRLPTGVIPLTSVITTVTYGSDERVVLHFKNSHLFSDIPISDLAANITERGNPGNIKGIGTAEVQLPADILRRGFHFIDTPGLGSSIAENTRTTEAFLPEADALILVTSYDSPLSEEEIRTLDAIRAWGRHCFVVINKQDVVGERERGEVRAHIQSQLARVFVTAMPELHSVSATKALDARLQSNPSLLNESGLPALEQSLIAFLIDGKRREFILNMCQRITELAASACDQALRIRIAALQEQLGRPVLASATTTDAELGIATAALRDCEVCREVAGSVFDYLARYQRLLREDADAQARHVACGGLCGRHLSQFEAMAAPREVCTGFAPILERQAARLRAVAHEGATPAMLCDAVAETLPSAARCPVCDVANACATQLAHTIASRIRHTADDMRSVLCLEHLSRVIPLLSADVAAGFLKKQSAVLDRLAGDMRRFALKQDGSRRYLASREELTAGRRGLRALGGDPNAATEVRPSSLSANVVPFVRRPA